MPALLRAEQGCARWVLQVQASGPGSTRLTSVWGQMVYFPTPFAAVFKAPGSALSTPAGHLPDQCGKTTCLAYSPGVTGPGPQSCTWRHSGEGSREGGEWGAVIPWGGWAPGRFTIQGWQCRVKPSFLPCGCQCCRVHCCTQSVFYLLRKLQHHCIVLDGNKFE